MSCGRGALSPVLYWYRTGSCFVVVVDVMMVFLKFLVGSAGSYGFGAAGVWHSGFAASGL